LRKSEYASKNFYDIWLPTLAPSAGLVKLAQGAKSEREWNRFMKKYRAEMATSETKAALDLLAALFPSDRLLRRLLLLRRITLSSIDPARAAPGARCRVM